MNQKYFFLLCLLSASITHSIGTVIVLHGTGSSGKSSIGKILLHKLPGSVYVSIDDFFWPELFEYATKKKWFKPSMSQQEKIQMIIDNMTKLSGHLNFLTILEKLYKHTKNLAQDHEYVILDTVFGVNQRYDYNSFRANMENIKVFSVLVYCPPSNLAEHVIKRNSGNKNEEKRNIAAHLKAFTKMYHKTTQEDAIIDTINQEEIAKTLKIIQTYLIQSGVNRLSVHFQIKSIKEKYLNFFSPNVAASNDASTQPKTINIKCNFPYDFMVNTKNMSPAECTELVYQEFLKNLNE